MSSSVGSRTLSSRSRSTSMARTLARARSRLDPWPADPGEQAAVDVGQRGFDHVPDGDLLGLMLRHLESLEPRVPVARLLEVLVRLAPMVDVLGDRPAVVLLDLVHVGVQRRHPLPLELPELFRQMLRHEQVPHLLDPVVRAVPEPSFRVVRPSPLSFSFRFYGKESKLDAMSNFVWLLFSS